MNRLVTALAFLLSIHFSPSDLLADEVSIPVMVGQTGASALFGRPELDAYTLAIEEWNAKGGLNGKKISLKVEDSQTSQRHVLNAFQRLALDKPSVILGPTWLDTYQAVIPVARKKEILLVTPSAARESFSKENLEWAVTFYHNSTREAKALVDGLIERGHKRIAVIYEQETFAEMMSQLVLKAIPDPVDAIGVQAGEAEFYSILTKLKTKKPDALIVLVWEERSLLSLLQQLRNLLPDLKLATIHDGEGWLTNPAFKTALPQLIYSTFIIADDGFDKRFEERFGYKPMLTASNAYDAMNAILSAKAAGKDSAQEIRNYLFSEELTTTTFGTFKFEEGGNVPSKIKVVDFPLKAVS